jgi:hypothetical protein
MAFDLGNYNIVPGSETDLLAEHENRMVEALSDGLSFKDDSGPVFLSMAAIASILQGKPKAEIRVMLMKSAAANVMDELAEAGVPTDPPVPTEPPV